MLDLDYLGGCPLPKSNASLLQGTLDMLILKALSLGALHGYGVGQRIAQISGDALRVEEGSLYPDQAQLAARESFGDFDRFKAECCEISRSLPFDPAPVKIGIYIILAV